MNFEINGIEKIVTMVADRSFMSGAAFGGIMFASAMMNNLFVTYYLDLFMNLVKIEPFWFFLGQTVFMVWNALNDPLFGWISDTFKGENVMTSNTWNSIKRRLTIIKYGGFLWTIAFILVWFPPEFGDSNADATVNTGTGIIHGLHFMFALCFYDGMLTLVEVNHSALLVEITSSSSERAKYNAFSATFAGLGSLSSLVGHASWSKETLFYFRITCLVIAIISSIIFFVAHDILLGVRSKSGPSGGSQTVSCGACGTGTSTSSDASNYSGNYSGSTTSLNTKELANANGLDHRDPGNDKPQSEGDEVSVYKFFTQITKHHNLSVFMVIYFVQGFDCTFEKNHFGIFLEGLVGDAYSTQFLGSIISASFVLPWIVTLLITPMIQKHGIYSVMRGVFISRVVFCSLSMLFTGNTSPTFTCGFLLINRIMSETVCRLCPLVISDIVDEDRFMHNRQKPMSATIIGASTLLGKGSQSLAPMLGYALFSEQFRDSVNLKLQTDATENLGYNSDAAKENMSRSLVFIPLVCVLIQTYFWIFKFNLRGTYLKQVKNYVAKSNYSDEV